MLGRLNLAGVRDLFARDLPSPIVVPNLIMMEDFDAYRWYGVLVMPLMKLTGGGVRWMGNHLESFRGEPQAEKLLLVEYPSHRRFMLMTLNPLYLLINRFRERGVASFEASFGYSPEHEADLDDCGWLVGVHFNADEGDALDDVKAIVEGTAGRFVYSTRETAPIDFFTEYRPTDPNPLTFKRIAFFAFPSAESAREAVAAEQLKHLSEVTDGFSAHLYEPGSPTDYVPRSLPTFS